MNSFYLGGTIGEELEIPNDERLDALYQYYGVNDKRALELQGFERNIQEAEQNAGLELQKKQAELLQPIIVKAKNAVVKVAKAKGYQYVLDASEGGGVILAEGYDLLADVKKELGF